MKRRQIKKSKKNGAPTWMVTYSDMITLILVFFILLFSMSQLDVAKFEEISDAFRNRMIFDFYSSTVPTENPTPNTSGSESAKSSNKSLAKLENNHNTMDEPSNDSLQTLMEHDEKYLDKNELNNVISASRNERGVVLVLQELILFNPGEAEILPKGEPFLNKIGSLLANIPNKIKVEGHTDSKPMSSYRYPSNWELSGARASSVVRYLTNHFHIDKSRFIIAGYADTKPLVPNNSPENMSKNRRVEIVILEDDQ